VAQSLNQMFSGRGTANAKPGPLVIAFSAKTSIEAVMRTMSQPKITHTLPDDCDNGDANLET
jgi:hypothetical protein